MDEIAQSLARILERHRIVFWYDTKRELRAEFDALTLDGVEKVVLESNQFSVKHRILREHPDTKFLLYAEGPPPDDLDNWLLDVQLAQGEFRADQTALWLTELGLGFEFADVVAPHADFFKATRRREALKALLEPDDSPPRVRLKMLAVCVGAAPGGLPRLDSIMENLLAALAMGKEERFSLVQRCALDDLLWELCQRSFGYVSETPSMRDFVIELFKSCYASGIGEPAQLTNDAVVFMDRWKDSTRNRDVFEQLSEECAGILTIEQDLQERDYAELGNLDLFELIDRKVLSGLVHAVADRTLSNTECDAVIRRRRVGHWYDQYADHYEAVGTAARFLNLLDQVDLTVHSLEHGVQQYGRVWYQLDQLYRQFVHHVRTSGQATLLAPLMELVDNLYTNNYLLPLNDHWQPQVDASESWQAEDVLAQQAFYIDRVRPYLARGHKVFVVISDAMRYEVGEELLRLIRQEDRYDAGIEPALSVLPSYTQLGMAALLPHESLALSDDGGTIVFVDGNSSQGTANRRAILEQALPGKATAVRATDLMSMGRDESRALIRDHDVVYVYHNRIDATGDKRDTEERVFEAVDETLDELVKLVKKLANANANNMLITADHGFIYQHHVLDESDFASSEPQGQEIRHRNRRFVIGRGLVETDSFKKYTADELGLEGDAEVLLPKSINRLRLQGTGSRYVHGGASLQEVVIPVIKINKKRASDITTVAVDILRGSTTTISTGQVSIIFYQTAAVTDKVQPRKLRVGIYTQDGVLISDSHDLVFDFTSDNARERELSVQFVLTSEADSANNQEVILRLDERVGDTSHYREYKSTRYVLRRSFTSDFDF